MESLRSAMDSLRAFGAVFANPRLRRLQLAGIGSTLGTWAYSVGLAVFAYHSGGARAVGILYAARWGSAAFVAPLLSVFADRSPRRRVMLTADLVRVGVLAGMAAVAAAHGPALVVYALAVVISDVSTVFGPAQSALLPSLVTTPDELTAANAVQNIVASVGQFAGPALGGALLALSGTTAVFVATAASFLWSALCIVRLPRDPAPEPDTHEGHAFLVGFRVTWRHPVLRTVIGLSAAQTLVAGAVQVLVVVLALRLLHNGNGGVGWLNTAMGIGCLIGVVAVAALAGRKRLAGDFGIGILLWGLPLVLAALWLNLPVALLLFAAIGIGNTLVDVAGATLLQRSADDEVLGRVFGVLESLWLLTLALGALVTPGIVALLGPRGALVAVGLFLPLLLPLVWPTLRRIDATARVPTASIELLRTLPLFAPLPPTVLERLASSVAEVHVQALGEVVTQGARGDRFYVIRSGRAAVDVDGAETGELGPGEFFGEIALLRDVPRTATVRALEPLDLYALERDDFLAAVTGHAPSRAAADSIVAARLPAGAAL